MFKTRIIPLNPVMILEGEKKILILTDIHIGFESNLASNEVFLGKNSTINETIGELSSLIDIEKPDEIIILGDVKSSIKTISKTEWYEVPLFFESIKKKCSITLVPGNHDGNIERLIPEGVSMISSTGIVEDNILLTHGHTLPSENFSHIDKIIMGHLHPVFFDEGSLLNGQRVWVFLKTKKENLFPNKSGILDITIIPSFNRYFYATHKRQYKKSISPIIEKIKRIESARIITLDGTIIGDESLINQII